jgi:hypothetical protein
MIEQAVADFMRFIDFPLHVVLGLPLAAALLIHLVRARGNNPRLVRTGPWEGMPVRLDARVGPTLLAYGLLVLIIYLFAAWFGMVPLPRG